MADEEYFARWLLLVQEGWGGPMTYLFIQVEPELGMSMLREGLGLNA